METLSEELNLSVKNLQRHTVETDNRSELSNDAIWSSLPIATVVVDDSDCVVDINPAAEDLFNCSARAVFGKQITTLTNDKVLLSDSLQQVRNRQSPLLVDDFVIAPQNRDCLISTVQIAPLTEGQGQLLVCIKSREIEGKIGPGSRAKSAARAAVGLADMLSHEIRNPLSGIVGAAQLLSMKLQGDDRELTELIVEEAYRIRKLLEQVDQFGQTDKSECTSLNVHDLLDRACRLAGIGCAAGIEIKTEYDPSLPEVWAHRDNLLRVFLNLLQNAAEALEEKGGSIRIRTHYDRFLIVRSADGAEQVLPVHVEVMDDGPGMSPEIAANAFEPFVSGRKNGTGLGLALVSAILTDLGGWIAFDSKPGQTVFRVSLPVAADTSR